MDPSTSGESTTSSDSSTSTDPTTGGPIDTSGTGTTGASSSDETSGADSTTDEPAPVAPEPAVLQLSFSPIKQFDFSWSAADGATHYKLRERLPDGDEYAQLGAAIVGESVSWTMPLHLRFGASYILSACNDEGQCTDSEPVSVIDSMAGAVGYFKASNTEKGDFFGNTIALSGDGRTLAVGALWEDSGATGVDGDEGDNSVPDAGAVYVFVKTEDGWAQQAYLKASNPGESDWFSNSLALSSDGNTLAVGAWFEDSAAGGINGDEKGDSLANPGAAYVFVRDGSTWSKQAYIKAPSPADHEQFGYAVALASDGNTLAVSAWNSANGEGSVHVFVRATNTWSPQGEAIKPSNPGVGDNFGINLALSEHGDTLAVGAWHEDSGSGDPSDESVTNAGAAYVFARANNVWTQQAYIKASNPGANDEFGIGIALSADGSTLAVGAGREDSAGAGQGQNDESVSDAGAVYVFVRDGKLWPQRAYIKAANANAGDLFGECLALSAHGDVLAVNAYQEDSGAIGVEGDGTDNFAVGAGAVYVFALAGDAWTQRAYVKAPNTGPGDQFGVKVALSGDGDTLAIGAREEDSAAIDIGGNQANNTATGSGAAYLF